MRTQGLRFKSLGVHACGSKGLGLGCRGDGAKTTLVLNVAFLSGLRLCSSLMADNL